MDFEQYRKHGKEMVDYIADYLQNIRNRRVLPNVKPGYMRQLVPDTAPHEGEDWNVIMNDIERVIMPGITHWQSPYMHAYFPALNSFPSLLGDMLADAINCIGFTWASSPAATELETIVMDWLGKMIGLPSEFLHSNKQTMGGGVIQTTASDCTFVTLLAARSDAIRHYRANNEDLDDAEVNARLVAYCSDQAHSSVEKAGLIGLVKMRFLPSDEHLSLRGDTLQRAVDEDLAAGLIPFYLCATVGTTGACAFDSLKEIGPICEAEGIWMHIDAAYAGTAFICPEYRHFMSGVEHAQSFAFNPSKWMMVHFDCSAMWVKNSGALHRTFNVDPLYLKHENSGAAIDYMHWQIGLSRRFRALKLWFVIRSFGVEGLQKHVREGVRLAKYFEAKVRSDTRFEIPADRHLGMVVFRVKGDNARTEILLQRLNRTGKLHMVPAAIKGKYIIRFTVTSQYTTESDIDRDWKIIQDIHSKIQRDESESLDDDVFVETHEKEPVKESDQTSWKKSREFGMSLVLSNVVPMSPKLINGSYAAFFDNMVEFAKGITSTEYTGRPIRLSPRRRVHLRDQSKQQSLDIEYLSGNRNHGCFKQGSLDSKVEEILESYSNGSYVIKYPNDLSALNEHDEGENQLTIAVPERKIVTYGDTDKKKKVETRDASNGVRMFCKHCGHPVDVDD
ncbi:histidine decarboxylase-like [Ruditapes philippinarum]|uniref:histidine decarboxylase-like n=1 Tax=Ruditapes philippinarum TaxID=129788 RepID=UPI00295B67A7|nr:histidine decarboxylase-like [Ruditapes philippinarum]